MGERPCFGKGWGKTDRPSGNTDIHGPSMAITLALHGFFLPFCPSTSFPARKRVPQKFKPGGAARPAMVESGSISCALLSSGPIS
jgi:hypothetical protein